MNKCECHCYFEMGKIKELDGAVRFCMEELTRIENLLEDKVPGESMHGRIKRKAQGDLISVQNEDGKWTTITKGEYRSRMMKSIMDQYDHPIIDQPQQSEFISRVESIYIDLKDKQ